VRNSGNRHELRLKAGGKGAETTRMGRHSISRLAAVWAVSLLAWPAAQAADLSDIERRWLAGLWPVIEHARQSHLPLDIVVQPQPTPGLAPLALAFVGGRCKLVLSMRGNAEAAATLERISPDLMGATLELMAAHELGHCRRYLEGAWLAGPAGFAADAAANLPPALRSAWLAMQAQRREEGYGDLVGLAWTRQRHPALYPRLQAWLLAERSRDRVPGSSHDTLAWVKRAGAGAALDPSADAPTIYEAAARVWESGLADDE